VPKVHVGKDLIASLLNGVSDAIFSRVAAPHNSLAGSDAVLHRDFLLVPNVQSLHPNSPHQRNVFENRFHLVGSELLLQAGIPVPQ
jgi:hypothetical protein